MSSQERESCGGCSVSEVCPPCKLRDLRAAPESSPRIHGRAKPGAMNFLGRKNLGISLAALCITTLGLWFSIQPVPFATNSLSALSDRHSERMEEGRRERTHHLLLALIPEPPTPPPCSFGSDRSFRFQFLLKVCSLMSETPVPASSIPALRSGSSWWGSCSLRCSI